jgi:hypothetical protein
MPFKFLLITLVFLAAAAGSSVQNEKGLRVGCAHRGRCAQRWAHVKVQQPIQRLTCTSKNQAVTNIVKYELLHIRIRMYGLSIEQRNSGRLWFARGLACGSS